ERWRYNRMAELGFPHEAIGEPTPGLIPAPKAEEQQMAKMPVAPQFSGQQSQGGMNWPTIQSAIQRYAGFQPGVTDIAKGYQLTQEQANRLLNQPLAQPAAQPIPAPTVGWYQIEGQPRQVITDEYWKTPVQGGGSFNVIPGSAAGPQWAPPVTLTVGGKEYTLPATTVIDLAKNLPKETPKPPEWTIPPQFESKIDELTKIIQAPPGTYTIDQRNLAAHALSDLNRQVLEFNKGQMDVWRAQMGYPLQEREVAARERGAEAQAMGATAQLMTAGPHAEYYRKLAKEGQLVPPGYAVFSPETQQKLFEHREKSEPIWRYIHDAMAFATEKTPTGEEFRNPASFVGYLNMIGKVFDIEELKNLKFKDLSQSFIAPYIHRLLQTSPKTQNLKPGSAEYNEAFAATLRELYK
ncbi:MAG: hypothetical protein ABIN58_07865, partial [candidate division WOR-3 bacterium]